MEDYFTDRWTSVDANHGTMNHGEINTLTGGTNIDRLGVILVIFTITSKTFCLNCKPKSRRSSSFNQVTVHVSHTACFLCVKRTYNIPLVTFWAVLHWFFNPPTPTPPHCCTNTVDLTYTVLIKIPIITNLLISDSLVEPERENVCVCACVCLSADLCIWSA